MKKIVLASNGHRHRAVGNPNYKMQKPAVPIAELGNTPVLWRYALKPEFVAVTPFAGKRTLVALHALPNLTAFLAAMMMLGLDPAKTSVFVKGYNYGGKATVLNWLKKHGFELLGVEGITADYLAALETEVEASGLPVLIVEDGGYFSPKLHVSCPSLLPHVLGIVEQTSRGRDNLLEAVGKNASRVGVPVISIPDSKLKQRFEPAHVANGILLALQNLIPTALSQLRIALLGYGVIGESVAAGLVRAGADLTVFDPKFLTDPASLYAPFTVAHSAVAAATGKNVIIGASGRESITRAVIDTTSDGTYLASASSEKREIDVAYLEEIATAKDVLRHRHFFCEGGNERVPKGTTYRVLPDNRELYLLHDGQPINFLGFGGMEDKEADLILSLMLVSAAEIALGNFANQPGLLTTAVDGLDSKHGIGATFIGFHRPQR
jgi:S-adenosylhomocysteine hydrolase